MNSRLRYDIWLSTRKEIGNMRAKLLVDYFGTTENIYNANESDLLSVRGISRVAASHLMDKSMRRVDEVLSSCEKIGCNILSISDSEYPERLRNIYDPPRMLYIRGVLPKVDVLPVIGIVGTRRCTPYGVRNTEKVSYELSQRGIIVATGLAKGIDTAAAKGGLAGGSPVIGVIGTGVDIAYPAQNRELFRDVAARGAIVSEYPPGTLADPGNFPSRNRIISGLSSGVAVIEAPQRSGALITAAYALEQGRDVFTMPGNVDAISCEGSNNLLREGAIPFMTAEDIIEEYIDMYDCIKKLEHEETGTENKGKRTESINTLENRNSKKPIDNSGAVEYIENKLAQSLKGDERIIAEAINKNPLHDDEIILDTGLSPKTVLTTLTNLELMDVIKRNNSGKWEIMK